MQISNLEHTSDGNFTYKSIDKKAKRAWRIGRFVFLLVFLAILAIPYYVLPYFEISFIVIPPNIFEILKIITIVIISIIMLYIFVFPTIEYKRWGYFISDDKVEFRKGLFFIKIYSIPIIRLQHITTTQGPIYKICGLSSISMSTASGTFEIIGLKDEVCREISELLKNRLLERERISTLTKGNR